jgi:MFS family permease
VALVTDATRTAGSWRVLLGHRYLGTSTLLAGGVALYATNEFLTISLLPSTIADIGGERLFAWVTTMYLVGSVVAAAAVNAAVLRFGARMSYLLGLAVFGIGSVVCAVASNMEVLLAGRVLQGAAGGLLAGLGYAVISTALPQALWTRASALVSAMWGVATVVGPATGGFFAQFGLWRWAFGAMAMLTAAMAVLVPVALPAGRVESGGVTPVLKIPVWSLLLLGAAALTISVAQVPRNGVATVALLAASVLLVAIFLVVDRRTSDAVLPASIFRPGPLKWIYLTMALLMASAMVDMYVPLFGQRLAHLIPVVAGFLGAALAVGWTVSEIIGRRRRRVGGGVSNHRIRHRGGVAALVSVGDAICRRRQGGRGRRRGNQYGATDLGCIRRRAGRRGSQQRARRSGHGRSLAVRGVRSAGRAGSRGLLPRQPCQQLIPLQLGDFRQRTDLITWVRCSCQRSTMRKPTCFGVRYAGARASTRPGGSDSPF